MEKEKEELIDLNKMGQRDMLTHLYRDVQSIKASIDIDQKVTDQRIGRLERSEAENKGVRLGLALAVTILSLSAFAVSIFNAITN